MNANLPPNRYLVHVTVPRGYDLPDWHDNSRIYSFEGAQDEVVKVRQWAGPLTIRIRIFESLGNF